MRVAYWQFPRKYLSQRAPQSRTLHIESAKEHVELSSTEYETLKCITTFSDASEREWAKRLGIALSTLQYRLRALQEKQVLKGWIYSISPSALQVDNYKLLIYLSRARSETIKKLVKHCEKHQRIHYCLVALGAWDFEIGVECDQNRRVSDIVSELFELYGDSLRNIKVIGELEPKKFSLFPW